MRGSEERRFRSELERRECEWLDRGFCRNLRRGLCIEKACSWKMKYGRDCDQCMIC